MAFEGTIQEFTLMMHGPALRHPCVEVQQGDTASRNVLIHLKTFDGKNYTMPYDATVVLSVIKSDGKRVLNDCEVVDQSTVLATLNTQTIACYGEQKAQLYICNDDGDIKSQGFYINVPKAVYSDDAVESADEYGVLRRLIQENQDIQAAEVIRADAETERVANEEKRQSSAEVMETAIQSCMEATEEARVFSREKSDAIVQTSSGTSIVVQDSSDDPVRGLKVFGRTEQFTTTGAQLLKGTDTLWSDGVKTSSSWEAGTWRKASSGTGTITVSSQGNNTLVRIEREESSGGSIDIAQNNVPIETGKMYTMSALAKGSGNIRFQYGIGAYKTVVKPLANTFEKLSYTFTAEEQCILDGKTNIYFGVSYTTEGGLQPWVEFYDMMLCEGDSTQDWEPYTGGMPSPNPDYPQELVSVGDGGNIEVNITDGTEDNVQSLTIQTPNGLPGIPVTDATLANYTDADGQMWCCDEVDLERGVYVQRVCKKVFDGSESWVLASSGALALSTNDKTTVELRAYGFCSHFTVSSNQKILCICGPSDGYIRLWNYGTLDDFKAFLSEQYTNGTPVTFEYILDTSVETPLTDAELAAYQSLHSNYPVTTVLNDAEAHMEFSYNADPKNYIAQNYVPKSSYEALESRVAALEQKAIS